MATSSQLTPSQQAVFNSFGSAQRSLFDLNQAVSGPGILRPPIDRIMTGAVSPAHAAEQNALVSGQDPTRPIREDGKSTGTSGRIFSPGGKG